MKNMDPIELPQEVVGDLLDAFKDKDTDEDGAINPAELHAVLRSMGQNPTEAELQVI